MTKFDGHSVSAPVPDKAQAKTARSAVKTLALASAAMFLIATAALAQDAAAPAAAAPAAPAPAPMSTPSMAGPLAANPAPFSVDLPDWLGDAAGKVYIGGAITGLGYYQSNPTHLSPGDASSLIDLDNAQLFIQKTDGWLQFYVQGGSYSLPTIGVPYLKASYATAVDFGNVPVAYLKLQGEGGLADFSLQAGKLTTLIGNEYNFTFQNMNIERGLLWNTEPAVSRGVQLNYSSGPLSLSVSYNDGIYSNNLNWLSGLATYVFSPSDTLAFAGGGNLGGHNGSLLNQGDVFNLIWTHTSGNWVISPYFQYTSTPSVAGPGGTVAVRGTSDLAGAVLATYSLNDYWKVAARAEYEDSSGHNYLNAPNILGYGAGSNAWSFTVTPTYQWKAFFARADFSYVAAGSATAGDAFGTTGTVKSQTRIMLETGILF